MKAGTNVLRAEFAHAAKIGLAIGGLIGLVLVPLDDFILGIMVMSGFERFMPEVVGWGNLLSFFGALVGSMVMLWFLLAQSLRLTEAERPAGAKLTLRAIDVFWYIGAAFAALIAVSQIDVDQHTNKRVQWSEMRERSQWAFYYYHAEALAVCETDQIANAELPSPDLLGAMDAISKFCAEQDWIDETYIFHEISVDQTCVGFANPAEVTLVHERGRRGNRQRDILVDEGLQAEQKVFAAIEKVQQFCAAYFNLQENLAIERGLEARVELGKAIGETERVGIYLRFIAFLIGMRLFRGISEFRDEWLRLKASKT